MFSIGIYVVPNSKATVDVTSSKTIQLSRITNTPVKQANTYTIVSVLLVITVVSLACWIPHWLNGVGLDAPPGLERMFSLNSVVNPLIYHVMSGTFRQYVRQFYRHIRSRLASYHC